MGALFFPSSAFSDNFTNSGINATQADDTAESSSEDVQDGSPVIRDVLTTENFNKLKTKAEKDDTVSVIVGLSTSFELEGTLDYSNVQAQKSKIKQEQGSLLNYLSSSKADKIHKFEHVPFIAMTVDKNTLERLESSLLVATISEDVLLFPTLDDSVPLIGAPQAWSSGYSGQGQAVAILDTGVDNTHSAFSPGRIIEEACYSSSVISTSISLCPSQFPEATGPDSALPCSSIIPGCDHGTHVAGIAAGNDATITGVAKDANIIAIQVFSMITEPAFCAGAPPCLGAYRTDVIKGFDRLMTLASPPHNIDISSVNLSLGVGGYSSAASCDAADPSTKAAVDNLRSIGIATIASAGNAGFTNLIATPACLSSVVSVSSTTKSDVVSSFSNSANYLDLLAPGQSIFSSVPGGYTTFSGTSMSTPHVAGSWAILMSAVPGATVDDVLNSLKNTGKAIIDTRNGLTFPRIQVDDALNDLGVVPAPPPPDITPPSVGIWNPKDGDTVADTTKISIYNVDDNYPIDVCYSIDGVELECGLVSVGQVDIHFLWDTTTYPDGSHNISAESCDPSGNCTTASTVTVIVDNVVVPADITPPSVGIWNPRNGDTVADTTKISIYSIDDDPNPVNVCYSIDGVELECKLMGVGKVDINFLWDTTSYSDGSHSIDATSCDTSANCATASTVTVVVDNIP